MTTRVLLDTDIGSHLDDALCLSYLLARDDCELVGITTVGGEADRRAMLANTVCWASGQAVPVLPGSELTRDGPDSLARAPQAVYLSRWPRQERIPSGGATALMSGLIRAYPNEVVLLAIGPLTNVARLMRQDPTCIELLRALYVMGGVFGPERRAVEPWERNTSADPTAARLIYTARVARHRTIGLDVSRQVNMRWADLAKRLRREALGPVYEWAEDSLDDDETVGLSDVLAAASALDEHICRFERGTVSVELVDVANDDGTKSPRASTTFQPSADTGPHEVALGVRVDRFFDGFWAELGTSSSRSHS